MRSAIMSSAPEMSAIRSAYWVGRGIGFRAKAGDEVDPAKVEKEFFLKSRNVAGKLYALLAQTPEVYMEIADDIVRRAQEVLGKSWMRRCFCI